MSSITVRVLPRGCDPEEISGSATRTMPRAVVAGTADRVKKCESGVLGSVAKDSARATTSVSRSRHR